MTPMLRIVLICGSVLMAALMIHKIRQSRVQIEDSLFWVFCSIVLVVFSIFPRSADILSRLVGTYSTSNFIFLFVIFLLLVRVFSMTIRISQLETRLKELVQTVALEQKRAKEGEKEEQRYPAAAGRITEAKEKDKQERGKQERNKQERGKQEREMQERDKQERGKQEREMQEKEQQERDKKERDEDGDL